jgi:hypothetical protein
MEPAALIRVTGAVLGIADVVTKSLKSWTDLQSKYQLADTKFNISVGQLSTLNYLNPSDRHDEHQLRVLKP